MKHNFYKEYIESISAGNEYFKISLKEFKDFLKEKNLEEDIKKEIEDGIYYTACDYAIPIIILKALFKEDLKRWII